MKIHVCSKCRRNSSETLLNDMKSLLEVQNSNMLLNIILSDFRHSVFFVSPGKFVNQ